MDEKPKQRAPGSLKRLITLGVFVLALFSLAPYAPVSALATDLPSHFVLQYFIGCFFAAAILLIDRYPRYLLGIVGICFALNLYQLAPLLPMPQNIDTPRVAGPLKILQVNTLFLNEDPVGLKKLIADENPDVIFAAEVNSPFAFMLRGLKDQYPVQAVYPEDETPRGMALLAKTGDVNIARDYLANKHIPSLTWALNHQGYKIRFVSIHPFTPTHNLEQRDAEFDALAKKYGGDDAEVLVVLGDFNATPYCPALKKFTAALQLKNARDGFGTLGTFPAAGPFSAFRIPIDNLLYRGPARVTDYHLGADIGSDHLPSLITLEFHQKSAP